MDSVERSPDSDQRGKLTGPTRFGFRTMRERPLAPPLNRSIVITGFGLAAGVPQHAGHEVRDVDAFTGQHAGQ